MNRPDQLPRPIDPLARTVGGRYEDEAVTVFRLRGREEDIDWTARTPHFAIGADHGRLLVGHRIAAERISQQASALIARELFLPGWLTRPDTFERILTGVVLSGQPDAVTAWETFYRNSLDELRDAPEVPADHADLAPVYRYAQARLANLGVRSVLDLGSCFGFFPLRLKAAGFEVRGSDVEAGSAKLLRAMSIRLGLGMGVLTCDAAAVPLPDGAVDAVTVLHVAEHVDDAHGRRILDEAVRLARRAVLLAVPFEEVPTAAHGHVRTFDADDLRAEAGRVAAAGRAAPAGWRAEVLEHHGGWLILESPQ